MSEPRWHGRLRRFARSNDGVSALEFALVLPFMLTLYLGSVELGDGLAVQYKTTLAARTVTDLTSQYPSIDGPTMSQILNAAMTVVAPYSTAGMAVTVSELQVNQSATQATVQWSCSLNGTPYAKNTTVALPQSMQSPAVTQYLVFGEVTYPYQPTLGYVLTGTINIYESVYFYPRMATQVTGPSSGTAPVSCS